MDMNNIILDSQSMVKLKTTAEQIEQEVMQVTLSDTIYPELVKIFTGMSPYADRITTYVGMPGVGRMVPYSNGGMDFPNVSQEMRSISTDATSFVCGYSWTLEEVYKAQYMGYNLESDRVRIAYEVAEREKERFVLHGDEVRRWRGLFTNTDPQCMYLTKKGSLTQDPGDTVDLDIAPGWAENSTAKHKVIEGGEWSKADSNQAYTDIVRMFTEMRMTTRDTGMADTLLISVDKEAFLHEPYRVAVDGTGLQVLSMSVLEYLRTHNPYTAHTGIPLRIKTVYDLPKGTAVLYNSSIETLRFILAKDLSFMGPQQWGYELRWFGNIKVGGLQYLKPKNIIYLKGI